MRTISRISAAFMLLDSYSKGPVLGASILVDGARVKYVSKGDGTYVFSNLPLTPHRYEISAQGYCNRAVDMPVTAPHLPEVLLMQHAPGTAALGRFPHYRMRFLHEKAPLAQKTVRVALLTQVGGLRVVKKASKGEFYLSLAQSYSASMLYQTYVTDKLPGETVMITGYERATGQYELLDPIAAPLGQGALLRPVWDLVTDRDGVAVLPARGLFLQQDELEFLCTCGEWEKRLVTQPPSPSADLTVDF